MNQVSPGLDSAVRAFDRFGNKIEDQLKPIFGKKGGFDAIGDILQGKGSVGGLTGFLGALETTAQKVDAISVGILDGKKGWAELADEAARSVPIFGDAYKATLAINRMVWDSAAAIAKFSGGSGVLVEWLTSIDTKTGRALERAQQFEASEGKALDVARKLQEILNASQDSSLLLRTPTGERPYTSAQMQYAKASELADTLAAQLEKSLGGSEGTAQATRLRDHIEKALVGLLDATFSELDRVRQQANEQLFSRLMESDDREREQNDRAVQMQSRKYIELRARDIQREIDNRQRLAREEADARNAAVASIGVSSEFGGIAAIARASRAAGFGGFGTIGVSPGGDSLDTQKKILEVLKEMRKAQGGTDTLRIKFLN